MKKPIWNKLVEYINSMPIGTIISRSEICYATDKPANRQNATDGYRRILTIVNILKIVSRGQYEIINHIDESFSYKQIRKIAYSTGFESWFIQIIKN